jgi:hypothetical protein
MKEETKQMGLMKKLTSAIVASSLVFTLVGSASAAYTADAGNTAATRMQALKIVQGMPDGTLGLDKEITRAELVTIIVRAFGQEDNAKLLAGSAAFTDTAKHWASGNIAMAQALVAKVGGDAIGMPDGSFAPDAKLTPAQAVAFLMKFLGVKADPAKAWPANYLDKAADMGLIAADDKAMIANQANTNATRGLAFYLFDRAFASYQLPSGKTFYTQYVDQTAPELTIKNDAVSTTMDASVTVTGTVTGASELYVGSTKVTPDASGNFSADVALGEVKADPYTITVTARDLAGNKTEKSIKVTRTVGAAATIEASDITVAAGGTANVTVAVKDAKGNVLAGQTVTGTSTVGTFDGAVFTAGNTTGTGKLTLTVGTLTKDVNVTVTAGVLAKIVPSADSVKVGEQVTFTAQDANGNAITGVTYTTDSANVLMDSTKGVMVASKTGTYTVTGTKDGKSVTGTVGVYSTDVAKVVVSAPATVVGNTDSAAKIYGGAYDVTVKAVDANGNLVANFDGPLTLVMPEGFTYDTTDDQDAVAEVDDKNVETGNYYKDATNGVATFKVYAESTGIGRQFSFGASATLADKTVIGGATSSEVTKAKVEVVEQVATSVKFSTKYTAKYVSSNESGNVTAAKFYVADQNGFQYIDTTGFEVTFTVAGAATIGLDDSGTNGKTTITSTYSGTRIPVYFESIKGKTGDATLTASVEGLGTATAKVTAAVAQDPAKLQVSTDVTTATAALNADDGTVTYTVQATDENGVPVVGEFNLTATLNSSANDNGTSEFLVNDDAKTVLDVDTTNGVTTFDVTTDKATGKATFTVAANKFVGDLKVTVSDQNTGSDKLSSADATVSFTADKATEIDLVRVDDIKVGYAAPKATIVAQAYDKAGNKALVAGKKVTFLVSDANGSIATDDVTLNGTAEKIEVTTDANGKATVEANVAGYAGDDYTVTIDKSDLTPGADKSVKVVISNAVAATLSYTLKDADGNTYTRPTAGSAVKIIVTAKDAAGKVVKDAAEKIVMIPAGTAYATYDGVKDEFSNKISKTDGIQLDYDGDSAGTYSKTVYLATAGTFSFTLEDQTSGTVLDQAGTARVAAAAPAKFVLNGGDLLTVDYKKASGAVTLKLADRFGNPVPAPTKLTASIEAFSGSYDENADKWTDPVAGETQVTGMGIRTATSAPDQVTLDIAGGQSSVTFYVWNSLDKGDYKVVFTYTKDATTYTGNLYVRIQ